MSFHPDGLIIAAFVIRGGSYTGATIMITYPHHVDSVSQNLQSEINYALDDLCDVRVTTMLPLNPKQGLAILGSDLYDPPFAAVIVMPIPHTVAEAEHRVRVWEDCASLMIHRANRPMTRAELDAQFINTIIKDYLDQRIRLANPGVTCVRGDFTNPMFRLQLEGFWVNHLIVSGYSLQKQIKQNKEPMVTGRYALIDDGGECHLHSEDVNYRLYTRIPKCMR